MSEQAKSLAEALNRVWNRVRYVQKDKRMQGGGSYTYVSDAALIDAIRPALVEEGVTFAPVGMEPLAIEVFENKNGNRQNRVLLRVTYRFTHAASRETLDVVTCGEGMDVGDKATNKAMTAAAKYALRQTFCVETGDDPDDTASQDQERKPAQQPKKTRAQLVEMAVWRVTDRAQLGVVYKKYDEDVKANRFTEEEKARLDEVFKAASLKYPRPSPA